MLKIQQLIPLIPWMILASMQQAIAACPPGPNHVAVHVTVQVRHDPDSGLYTYSYSVSNSTKSKQQVDDFALDYAPPISKTTSPEGWMAGSFSGQNTIDWFADKVAHPDKRVPGAAIPPSIVQIKPGHTLTGFSIQSSNPPGPVSYWVTGFAPIPPQPSEEAAEKLEERCPLSTTRTYFDTAVRGVTIGPVKGTPVAIQIRPGSGNNPVVPVNPKSHGVLKIAILGAQKFDARSVDADSVRAGPGHAKQVGKWRVRDVNSDGFPDLLLRFDIADLKLRCRLDQALFLKGNIAGNGVFSSGATITTVGCSN